MSLESVKTLRLRYGSYRSAVSDELCEAEYPYLLSIFHNVDRFIIGGQEKRVIDIVQDRDPWRPVHILETTTYRISGAEDMPDHDQGEFKNWDRQIHRRLHFEDEPENRLRFDFSEIAALGNVSPLNIKNDTPSAQTDSDSNSDHYDTDTTSDTDSSTDGTDSGSIDWGLEADEVLLRQLRLGLDWFSARVTHLQVDFPVSIQHLVRILHRISSKKDRHVPEEMLLVPSEPSVSKALGRLAQLVPLGLQRLAIDHTWSGPPPATFEEILQTTDWSLLLKG